MRIWCFRQSLFYVKSNCVRFNAFILLSTPQVLLESCIDIDSLLPYD